LKVPTGAYDNVRALGLVDDVESTPEQWLRGGDGDWNGEPRKGQRGGLGRVFIGGQRRRKKEGSGRVGLLPCVGDGGRMPCMAAPLTGREKEGGARGRKGMRRGRKERVLTGGARSAVRERGRARAGV